MVPGVYSFTLCSYICVRFRIKLDSMVKFVNKVISLHDVVNKKTNAFIFQFKSSVIM